MRWLGLCGALWLISTIGCASPIVGGECRDGYVVCNGMCVRLDDNFMHCGACNHACSALQICRAGECVVDPRADGGDIDGSAGGGSGGVGGGGSGGTGGSIVVPPDAGFPGCPAG